MAARRARECVLGAAIALRDRVSAGRLPTWVLGLAVALVTWKPQFGVAGSGLDLSWHTGLAMAAKQDLQFGTDVVFTYGPLGFLDLPGLWYGDLAVLAFCYRASLYIALAISLVWALRRTLSTGGAVVAAILALALLPGIEQPIALAGLICLGMLQRERAPMGLNAFVVAGASLAAFETMVKLSLGPLIFVMVLIALVGARARWWQIAGLAGIFLGEILVLWVVSGQSLPNLPDFVGNSVEIVRGYNEAMAERTNSSWTWVAAVLAPLGVVAAGAAGAYRDRFARWAAVGLLAVTAFALFKQGVVRFETNHVAIYISTICVLWLAIPWEVRHRSALISGAAVLGAIALHVLPPLGSELDPLGRVKLAGEQARTLLNSGRRDSMAALGRAGLKQTYRLDQKMLADLYGHSVSVDPWEIAAAWAYGLDWSPLPVFQNYSAYTSRLDELNAAEIEDPEGPERILRENPAFVPGGPAMRAIDGRYPAWDPPAQARATLCHFVPLRTTRRWQVLGRVPDRCARPKFLRRVESSFGEAVPVPAAGPGEVVFARVHGAGVDGFERLTATLWRPQSRYAIVNGSSVYRLVPGTATNGLMLRAGGSVAGNDGPFSQVPQAKTITLTGVGGDLRFEFYAMKVRAVSARSRGGGGPG